MKKLFVMLLASLIFASCNSGSTQNEKPESETLFDEVMVIHDEVMPKMGDLRKREKSLQAQIENLNPEEDADQIATLQAKAEAVKAASENMMGWMRAFDPDKLNSMEEAQKIEYLKDEKVKIQKVNTDIKEALDIQEK